MQVQGTMTALLSFVKFVRIGFYLVDIFKFHEYQVLNCVQVPMCTFRSNKKLFKNILAIEILLFLGF